MNPKLMFERVKEEYKLIKLFRELFLARFEKNHAKIASLVIWRMRNKFSFRPGFSDFSEIVIEYLSDGWTEVDYLEARYEFTSDQAQQVYDELERFKDFTK